jgi:hypothetical protein
MNALTQQLDSNTQKPFQALTSSILFNLFLQTAAEYPANIVTPMTPIATVQASLLDGQSFANSTARNIVYCAAQSAAYHVRRECFLYSFTQKMYSFYHNYETVAQGCFTHLPEKEYNHNAPASMNGSLLALCPTANTHIIKCLTPATIDAFTKNSPFTDHLGKSMCKMHLQQDHVQGGTDSSFNLLTIIEYQAVLDNNGFESGADLSPLKHQQKYLHHREQQQE